MAGVPAEVDPAESAVLERWARAPGLRWRDALWSAGRELADLYRDVFGYPFEPARFDPDWRTGTVVALARGMVRTGDFSPMPILGDALQDAGCPDGEEVLAHCRDWEPHARECWVLDLILARPA